jgi:Zn-finger nucleic acid-binding protein
MSRVAAGKCPACQATLAARTLGSVELDECPLCGGTWFDEDELRKVKDAADHDLTWLDFELWKHKDRFRVEARPERCPRCRKSMVAIDYDKTGVQVHYCTDCRGVWLDRGALQRIIAALEHELVNMSAAEYLKATLQEAKELVTRPEGFVSEWRDFLTVAHLLEMRLFVEHPGLLQLILGVQRGSPIR